MADLPEYHEEDKPIYKWLLTDRDWIAMAEMTALQVMSTYGITLQCARRWRDEARERAGLPTDPVIKKKRGVVRRGTQKGFYQIRRERAPR